MDIPFLIAATIVVALVGHTIWKGLDKADEVTFVQGESTPITRVASPLTFWSIVGAIVVANAICAVAASIIWAFVLATA
jgi:hypothetical protein